MKIGQMYDFKPLQTQRDKHLAFEATLPPRTIQMIQDRALVGIEIEVENIDCEVPITHYWEGKTDGSLRNNGAEFTTIPLRTYQVEYALNHLNQALNKHNNPEFTNRTSTHIHLNVRDMTWDQVKTLILLYAIFERHFFAIAGAKREKSIFCVPLYKSRQLDTITKLENYCRQWHKYNALNCGTILGTDQVPRFGTVEFRHLYGTSDTAEVCNWINNILCLRKAVLQYKLEELLDIINSLNTTSEYMTMYAKIFGKHCTLPPKDIEYCVSKLKRSIWVSKHYPDLYKYNKRSPLYMFVCTAKANMPKYTIPKGLQNPEIMELVAKTNQGQLAFHTTAPIKPTEGF